MKKIKLFAMAVAALLCGTAMAEDVVTTGAYSQRTISGDGLNSTWNFIGVVTSETKINGEMVHDNGLIFNAGAKDKLKLKSDQLSCQSQSSLYFNVPEDAAGTITMVTTSNSDSRYFQLFVNGVAGTDKQRLWSKAGDDLVKKGPQSYTFTSEDLTQVGDSFYLHFQDNNTEMKVGSFAIVLTSGNYFGVPADYPFVKSFTMGDVEAVVDTTNHTISATLDYVPEDQREAARAAAIASAVVVMGGTAKTYRIVGDVLTAIDSVDTGKNIEYSLTGITVRESASDDATLKSLSVNGTELAGFSADNLNYAYEIGYDDALPVVTAEKNDATADMVITDATEIPGNATVVVTAQNGTTVKTYTISFTRADALRELKQVILSNGMKANIYNGEKIIKGGYVGDAPTISSCVVDDGATWKMEGNDLVVTGLDGVSDTYSVELVAYTPYEAKSKSDAVTFDTTAVDGAYIHTIYGWDSSKGVKWSKPKDESGNMRIREGKNRVYFFFAACDSIDFIGGSAGARDVEVTINGVVYSQVTKTPAEDAYIRINVGGEAAMIGFESNGSTSGDSGFASMIVYNDKFTPTSLKSAIMSGKAVKFMRNGAMYIRRGNDIFNALGKQVKF